MIKKVLVGALILAVSGWAFAQDEGLKLSGSVSTGLRFETGQYVNDGLVEPDDKGKAENKDPMMSLWHDDHGGVRAVLVGQYTKDNYGLKFTFLMKNPENGTSHNFELANAFLWADFLNNMLRVTAGNIDGGAWGSAGAQGFHFADGKGVRFEVKPIAGLNFGLMLRPPTDSFGDSEKGTFATTSGWYAKAKDFLLETSFGAKYEHQLLDFAAGLKLDSAADGLNQDGWDYTFKYKSFKFNVENVISKGYDDADKGMQAYFGVNIKAVDKLTAAVEARLTNLGAFSDYGWVWINQKIAYDMTPLKVGLNMHQRLYVGDIEKANPWKGVERKKDNEVIKDVPPKLDFTPWVDYALNDKMSVNFELPITVWPGVVTEIGAKPKLTYKLGSNAAISGYYKFTFIQYDKSLQMAKEKDTAPDPLLNNAVQINFEWSF